MLCPRCQVETEEGRCPRCGERVLPSTSQRDDKTSPDTISFSVATQAPSEARETVDWREELKQKLQKHQLKKGIKTHAGGRRSGKSRNRPRLDLKRSNPATRSPGQVEKPVPTSQRAPASKADEAPAEAAETRTGKSVPEGDRGELVKQLFKYKLEDGRRLRDRRIITFSKSSVPKATPRAESAKRKPAAEGESNASPRQRQLTLEAPGPAAPSPSPTEATRPSPAPPPPQISVVETLFSRLLAGIIDVVLAGSLGFGFAWTASFLSGVTFPSVESLIVAAGCAWILLVLNEVFFLFTLKRTPGMIWTELTLEGEAGDAVGFQPILWRTLLWLPVTVTVVGLLWAVFDSQGRCLHDLLTGTRIVPGRQASSASPLTRSDSGSP